MERNGIFAEDADCCREAWQLLGGEKS